MKTTQEDFETKLNNLHTREKGISSEHQINYKELLRHVRIGASVLDVGCGTCWLKNYLPPGTKYYGLDAYVKGEGIINMKIEDLVGRSSVDTVFVFAALDGMQDLVKAFESIKKLAKKNVVILTGVNIPPDQYHTHLITEDFIIEQMKPFKLFIRKEVLKDKILFLEFIRQ